MKCKQKTFEWYWTTPTGKRATVRGKGCHVQDAFTKLSKPARRKVTFADGVRQVKAKKKPR